MSFTAAADSYDQFMGRYTRRLPRTPGSTSLPRPPECGEHLASLTADERQRVRDACRAALPDGPFTLTGRAWYARGTVPGEGVE